MTDEIERKWQVRSVHRTAKLVQHFTIRDHPELMQADRDHPTAEGDTVIVAKMLPVVSELVALVQR